MISRCAVVTFVIVSMSGCSSFDCCHWWGRNTDGSSNLGKKPTPYQQGPIAGTYTNPNAATTTAPVQQMTPPTTAPVVTTSPAQSYILPVEQTSPALTPPSPPSPLQNSTPVPPGTSMQLDDRSKPSTNGTFSGSQLPTAVMNGLPDNKPSIPSPVLPTPEIAGPTIPGAARTDNAPMPLILATPPMPSQNAARNVSAPPTIAMPEIAMPAIAKPLDIAPPKVAMTGKFGGLNPGTVPPPLAPPPAVPVFDVNDRK